MIAPAKLRNAEAHLAAADPRMGRLIEHYGPSTLGRARRDPFHILCAAVIAQQLSTRAAQTIEGRVLAALGGAGVIQPSALCGADPLALRACGLSGAKVRWLIALGEAARLGTLDFRRMRRLDDAEALAELDALPGIGRWTAEMMLIFALGRLDVFSPQDVGLMRGVSRVYNRGRPVGERTLARITRPWQPYRSVASWYLWRVAEDSTRDWT